MHLFNQTFASFFQSNLNTFEESLDLFILYFSFLDFTELVFVLVRFSGRSL